MLVEMLRSKIHRVKINFLDLDYVGSIIIDATLIRQANLLLNEKVQILNVNNGARFETYVLEGEADSGIIGLNGPAARLAMLNDIIIICAYGYMSFEEARTFQPVVIFPNAQNRLN